MNAGLGVKDAFVQLRAELDTISDEAAVEARLILCKVLDLSWAQLVLGTRKLDEHDAQAIDALLERRRKGEPLQYIFGEWEFMGLPFIVRPGVLIPRPETETLVEFALEAAREWGYQTALDLCCGSGCIAVSLNKLGSLDVTAADISPACIKLTRENALKNGAEVETIRGDMFEALPGRSFDMLLCNPPYIQTAEMERLQRELRFEPWLALCGGDDGLDFYRRIMQNIESVADGGLLALECGIGQSAAVRCLLDEHGFANTGVRQDLYGVERIVYGYRRKV